jgi:hypothetical protein
LALAFGGHLWDRSDGGRRHPLSLELLRLACALAGAGGRGRSRGRAFGGYCLASMFLGVFGQTAKGGILFLSRGFDQVLDLFRFQTGNGAQPASRQGKSSATALGTLVDFGQTVPFGARVGWVLCSHTLCGYGLRGNSGAKRLGTRTPAKPHKKQDVWGLSLISGHAAGSNWVSTGRVFRGLTDESPGGGLRALMAWRKRTISL